MRSRNWGVATKFPKVSVIALLMAGLLPQVAAAQDAGSGDGAILLGPVQVEGEWNGQAKTAESDPALTEGSGSYAPLAVTVGKSAQTLREVPQSVTVITRERLEDQNLVSVEDVMLQMTGVTIDRGWLSSTYTSRGLTVSNVRYDGGATGQTSSVTGDIDTAIFDNVALLRGADGLFGAGEAGGVINFTRKRALSETQFQLAATGGSWEQARIEGDVTGPLTKDGNVRARLIGVYGTEESFQDFKAHDRVLVHGSVEANLTPDTLLIAGYTYQHDDHTGFNVSLPRYRDGTDIDLPRSFNMGTPWNWIDRNINVAYARIEQSLGDAWTLRLSANHSLLHDKTNAAEMENAVDPIDGSGAAWWYFQSDVQTKETTLDFNTTGSFEAFGQKHDVILGVDYSRNRADYRSLWTSIGDADIFNPVYPVEPDFPPVFDYESRADVERIGIYGSLRVRPVSRLSLIGGGRLVLKDKTVNTNLITGLPGTEVDEGTKFVPYAGIVWDPASSISLYASFAEIYQSQADQMAGPRPGTPLGPVTGTNYEAGIKGEFYQGRLTASAAIYRVNKKGEAANDPNYPPSSWSDPCCYVRDGNLKSQGFEFELNGEVLPGWQVALGYTYNDNKNTRDNDAKFAEITPKHLLKLWTDYTFSEGSLNGLSLGGGVTAQSSNFRSGWIQEYNPISGIYDGDYYEYQFDVPGYAVWSAAAGYKVNDNLSINANLNNIFDKTYYITIAGPGYGNFYGDPRNFSVSARLKY